MEEKEEETKKNKTKQKEYYFSLYPFELFCVSFQNHSSDIILLTVSTLKRIVSRKEMCTETNQRKQEKETLKMCICSFPHNKSFFSSLSLS